jgi:hypothetical protein
VLAIEAVELVRERANGPISEGFCGSGIKSASTGIGGPRDGTVTRCIS